MATKAYYNEHDPYAAQWLRNLISAGHIAAGDVDERDIQDVTPAELYGYAQHHFFAGIGGWSLALRMAGWPDGRPVWTGSCPCQPFSAAGKRKGASDERHLWPALFHLLRECRPGVLFGEQVASKDGIAWFDTVSADLEGEGYACGPIVLPACGVGAPHIRQRLWFVAHPNVIDSGQRELQRCGGFLQPKENALTCDGDLAHAEGIGHQGGHVSARSRGQNETTTYERRLSSGLAHPAGARRTEGVREKGEPIRNEARRSEPERYGYVVGLAHHKGERRNRKQDPAGTRRGCSPEDGGGVDNPVLNRPQGQYQRPTDTNEGHRTAGSDTACGVGHAGEHRAGEHLGKLPGHEAEHEVRATDGDHPPVPTGAAGPTNGFWEPAEWLPCIDGKARPVEPGTFPLAYGVPARVGKLRAYGNAISPQAAAEVITAYLKA